MRIMGIDQSYSGTGCVVIEDGKILEQGLIKSHQQNSFIARMMQIKEGLLEVYNRNKPKDPQPMYVVREGSYSFLRNGKLSMVLAGLGSVIDVAFLSEAKINPCCYYIVPPTVLKKYVTGNGTSEKAQMLLAVFKRFGISFEDHNICDAYCLARFILDYKDYLSHVLDSDFKKRDKDTFWKFSQYCEKQNIF